MSFKSQNKVLRKSVKSNKKFSFLKVRKDERSQKKLRAWRQITSEEEGRYRELEVGKEGNERHEKIRD